MKKSVLTLILVVISICLSEQQEYLTFYYQRATLFENLKSTPNDIIFLGNSITNGAEWSGCLKI